MKSISDSKSILSVVMQPSQANPAGTVHGGEIMKIMDTCGSVTAKRHCRSNVVTVRVDELVFYEPIHVGELVLCDAQLVFVGKTSMEVKVSVKAENLENDDPARTALTAFFTYVALDKNGKPCTVEQPAAVSDEEKAAYEEGKQRYLARKQQG